MANNTRNLVWIFCALVAFLAPAEGIEKKATDSQWYVGFGPTGFGNLNASGMGVGIEGAKTWDMDFANIRVLGNFAIKGAAYMTQAGLGVSRILLPGDTAPYVSADLGYGFAKVDGGGILSGDTAVGFVLGGIAGVQLFRTSDVSFDLSLRLAYLLSDTSLGYPGQIGFRVGVVF